MTLILGIDTAGGRTSAAVLSGDVILASAIADAEFSSETLVTIISKALQSANKTIADVAGIGVATGPGSYTGIRAGLSAAAGLSAPRKTPVIGVSSLLAIALAGNKGPGIYLVKLAASGEDYYCGVFYLDSESRYLESSPELVVSQAELSQHRESLIEPLRASLSALGIDSTQLAVHVVDSANLNEPLAIFVARAFSFSSLGLDSGKNSEHRRILAPKAQYLRGISAKTIVEREQSRNV